MHEDKRWLKLPELRMDFQGVQAEKHGTSCQFVEVSDTHFGWRDEVKPKVASQTGDAAGT